MRLLRAGIAFLLILTLTMQTVLGAGQYINMNLRYDGVDHSYSAEEVTLMVEGSTLTELPMPPIIFEGYTLVPAREVFEALGAQVDWISDLYQVYVKYDEHVVMLEIDSRKAYVDGEPLEMAIAPKIINDKTMIPLRFASESIGMEVGWDGDRRIASVSKPVVTTTTMTTTTTTTTTTEATTETTTAAVNITRYGSSTDMSAYTAEEYDMATLTSLSKATDSGTMFLVGADREISSVTVTKLAGGTVAVDVDNSYSSLLPAYKVSDGRVDTIRVSGGNGNTRLLFNMAQEGDFKLYMSSNRRVLGISVGTNTISSVEMEAGANSDRLIITGSSVPDARITGSSTGDMITVDVTDAVLAGDEGSFGDGSVISGGTYRQLNTNTVRVSIDLQEEAGYVRTVSGNSLVITVARGLDMKDSGPDQMWEIPEQTEESTEAVSTSALSYDSATGLTLPGAATITEVNGILHSDNYNQLNYVLTLKGDYSGLFRSETFTVEDGNIKSVNVSVESDRTVVRFSESRIMAMYVTKNGNDIVIKPMEPKEMYSKIIVLDAGHGGSDAGTTYGSVYEKDINLAILNKARALFDASDIKCYATRTTDVYPSFDDRTNLADIGDAFISIHINSVANNTTASGTETFTQYANNLGNGLTSYILAERVLNKLVANLGTVNRKVKSNDLKVLRDSHVPATLAEIGFLTNAGDRAIMTSEDGQDKAARAIFDAVNELFNEYTPVR